MKAVFIGAESPAADIVKNSVGLRWPDTIPIVALTGAEGLELVRQESPDIVLFALHSTDQNILQTITEIRRFSQVPLIALEEAVDTEEMVRAFVAGVDGYVRLPCSGTELMARIRAVLRRFSQRASSQTETLMTSGVLLMDPNTYEAYLGGTCLALTVTEFRLLHLLVKNRPRVLTHDTLERALWEDPSYGMNGGVKKYVQRLRIKLGDDPRQPRWIASVRGVGYRFVGPVEAPEQFSDQSN